jgi:hypothetical protein
MLNGSFDGSPGGSGTGFSMDGARSPQERELIAIAKKAIMSGNLRRALSSMNKGLSLNRRNHELWYLKANLMLKAKNIYIKACGLCRLRVCGISFWRHSCILFGVFLLQKEWLKIAVVYCIYMQ